MSNSNKILDYLEMFSKMLYFNVLLMKICIFAYKLANTGWSLHSIAMHALMHSPEGKRKIYDNFKLELKLIYLKA